MADLSTIALACTLGQDDIWRTAVQESVSYPSNGSEVCFQVEEDSFWFRHRNACIEAAALLFPPPPGEPIFDVGGGNGFVSLGLLKAGFEVVLVEPSAAGAAHAKRRGLTNVVCGTTAAAGFPQGSLGAVGLFDVVEHIEEDLEFLRSIRALMKRGGRLYLTVPAYQSLWSEEDEIAGHFRRYRLSSISRLLVQAGFELAYSTYIFRPLLAPIFFMRALPYRLRGRRGAQADASACRRDHVQRDGIAKGWLNTMLDAEVGRIAAGRSMSAGGSCLVVASAG